MYRPPAATTGAGPGAWAGSDQFGCKLLVEARSSGELFAIDGDDDLCDGRRAGAKRSARAPQAEQLGQPPAQPDHGCYRQPRLPQAAGGPHLGANLVGRPNAPQLSWALDLRSCPRCILCTQESCDV